MRVSSTACAITNLSNLDREKPIQTHLTPQCIKAMGNDTVEQFTASVYNSVINASINGHHEEDKEMFTHGFVISSKTELRYYGSHMKLVHQLCDLEEQLQDIHDRTRTCLGFKRLG